MTGLGYLALTGGATLSVFALGLGAGFLWGRYGIRARFRPSLAVEVEPSLDRHLARFNAPPAVVPRPPACDFAPAIPCPSCDSILPWAFWRACPICGEPLGLRVIDGGKGAA